MNEDEKTEKSDCWSDLTDAPDSSQLRTSPLPGCAQIGKLPGLRRIIGQSAKALLQQSENVRKKIIALRSCPSLCEGAAPKVRSVGVWPDAKPPHESHERRSGVVKEAGNEETPARWPGFQEARTLIASDHPGGPGTNEKRFLSSQKETASGCILVSIARDVPMLHPLLSCNDHAAYGMDRSRVALAAWMVRRLGDMTLSVCERKMAPQWQRGDMVVLFISMSTACSSWSI